MQNQLPAELTRPPLPLVALVGQPEVHRELGLWASQVLRPPLIAIAVSDTSEAVLSRVFGASGGELQARRPAIRRPASQPLAEQACAASLAPRAACARLDQPVSPHPSPPRRAGAKKPPKPFAAPEGILKADWILKHRQRRAAVAVALVDRCGPPRLVHGAMQPRWRALLPAKPPPPPTAEGRAAARVAIWF
jgi:hypothetical protein